MDTFEYSFIGKTGNRYIVKIQKDGARFLSSQLATSLDLNDIGVWGIYLNKLGQLNQVTGIRDLSIISKQIYGFSK